MFKFSEIDFESKTWNAVSAHPDKQLAKYNHPPVYHDSDFNAELSEYISGKSIALVGPGSHITGKKYGNLIDSYDIVARINQRSDISNKLKPDFGNRTNILFSNYNRHSINSHRKNIEYFKSIDFTVVSMVSTTDGPMQENFLKHIKKTYGTKYHNMDDRFILNGFKKVGTTVNTGFMAIICLLNYDIRELFITGISFYNMGKMGNVYNDDYFDSDYVRKFSTWNKDRLIDAKQARLHDLHDQKSQITYFKHLLKKYYKNPITLDEYLEENFIK